MTCPTSSATSRAPTAEAGITSLDMMTAELSVLAATIGKDQLMRQCDVWATRPKTIGDLVSQYQTMLDTSSAPSASSGSRVFMWMFQQLSKTDWYGLPETSNSSTKWETAGKPGTSGGSGSKSSGSATPPGTSMSASTSTDNQWGSRLADRMGW